MHFNMNAVLVVYKVSKGNSIPSMLCSIYEVILYNTDKFNLQFDVKEGCLAVVIANVMREMWCWSCKTAIGMREVPHSSEHVFHTH